MSKPMLTDLGIQHVLESCVKVNKCDVLDCVFDLFRVFFFCFRNFSVMPNVMVSTSYRLVKRRKYRLNEIEELSLQ